MLRKKICNYNFQTQYAYINGNYINIEEYVKNPIDLIKCINGHDLVYVECSNKKNHFRHKNTEDVGGHRMTKWHAEWQGNFPETEKQYYKKKGQSKNRIADIVLAEKNFIVEIQHSDISYSEVICRTDDYSLHDMSLIWIIDGNTFDVELEELLDNNFLIIFHKDWKYKSFTQRYDYILLDIKERIFKIGVNEVCNKMFLAKEYRDKKDVICELLKSPNKLWDMWKDDNEIKASLTIQQKGAGNGKTFGIWKSISENQDKDLYIILTKVKSAVQVIKKELEDQSERNEFHIVDNIEYLDEIVGRQIVIKYQHKKNKKICKVIIGTIDSFIFNITENKLNKNEFFEGLLDTLNEYGCLKLRSNGSMRYGGQTINLNRKTQLWIDEAQDLNIKYFRAFVKIMIKTKIDIIATGDEFQSLEKEQNFMTVVKDRIPNINIIYEEAVNFNRRIKVKNMASRINNLIDFNKYNLPEITVDEKELNYSENMIELINEPKLTNSVSNKDNLKDIDKYLNKILDLVNREVEEKGRLPKDFLFIFPIMKSNVLAVELETKLNDYWINRNNNDCYKQYAILHKHEEGIVINTEISRNSARIMTIKSSKGDGRNVVFILGTNEKTLKLCSNNEFNLTYESHLHVALTRAKEQIYFGLTKNNDEIHQRFGSNDYIEFKPTIHLTHKGSISFNLNKILQYINFDNLIGLLKDNNIKELSVNNKVENNKVENNNIVDWEYHCIRRSIYINYALFKILKYNKKNSNFSKSQLNVCLNILSKFKINKLRTNDFYNYLNNLDPLDNFTYFPLCCFPDKEIYLKYSIKIKKKMIKIQDKYKEDNLSLVNLKPFEAFLLTYMIQLTQNKKYCNISPTSLYTIYDSFTKKKNDIKELINESEKIKNIVEQVMDNLLEEHNDISWNIEHKLIYGGNTENLLISKEQVPIIGHNKDTVFHFMFKTDFNSLNYWNTLVEVLLDRFLIYNPNTNNRKTNNKTRYKNKKIKTYLFVLKQNKFELFDWDWDKNLNIEIKTEIKYAIKKYFFTFNKQLFQYYNYVKNKKLYKGKFSTPLEMIIDEYRDIEFIRDLFNELKLKCNDGKKNEVLEITNDKEKFISAINEKLNYTCDNFFGLNIQTDDEEW